MVFGNHILISRQLVPGVIARLVDSPTIVTGFLSMPSTINLFTSFDFFVDDAVVETRQQGATYSNAILLLGSDLNRLSFRSNGFAPTILFAGHLEASADVIKRMSRIAAQACYSRGQN